MALKPGSEAPNTGSPEDYAHDHPTEHPSEWGWHATMGGPGRVAGWIVAVALLRMLTTTHYNGAGAVALITFTVILVGLLIWDIGRRRTSWRR